MTDDYQRALGARLRELRKSRGLSQQELADRSGLSQATISLFERGRHITLRNFALVCRALGMEPGRVMREAELGSVDTYREPLQPSPHGPVWHVAGTERNVAVLEELEKRRRRQRRQAASMRAALRRHGRVKQKI